MTRLLAAVALALFAVIGLSGQNATELDRHIAAAKAAAGADHAGLFEPVCGDARAFASPPAARGAGGGAAGRRGGGPPAPPARESWHAEPVKVFDNLYSSG